MAQKETKLATVSERILLHLIEFKSYTDEIDGPLELTQIGIARAVGVARKNIARVIHPLIEDGLVESQTVHISGIRLKRTIYYLTGPGYEKALKKKNMLETTIIQFIDQNGEKTENTLGDAYRLISFDVDFIDIVREANRSKIFDCQDFLKKQSKSITDSSIHQLEKILPAHFCGRETEEKTASQWLDSPSSRTLVIRGMPGMGKTSFMARLMYKFPEAQNIHYFRIQPWSTVRSTLKSLSLFFEGMGKRELRWYLDGSKSIDMSEVEYLFQGCLASKKKLLLVFDDFHHANSDVQTLFTMLHRSVIAAGNVKLMVAGRFINPFYEIHDVAVQKNIIEITLSGLDEKSTIALALDVGVSREFIDNIFAWTGGHPLFVELLGSGGTPDMNMDIEKFINDEFIQNLNKRELELLKYLSVHRYPIHREGLHRYQHVLSGLIEQSIIKQSENDFIELHDTIKTALHRRLSGKEMERFHSMAAEYYIEDFSITGLMEVLHHLLTIDRYQDAVDMILDKEEKLLNSDRMEELARTLAIILVKSVDIDKQEKARLLYMQGHALAFTGEWDDAIMHYKRAMFLAPEGEKLEMKAKSGIAVISLRRNNYSVARSLFEDIIDWADKNNEMEMKAESSYYLGTIHERLGNNGLALDHFMDAMKISFKTNNRNQLAMAYYGQGRIFQRTQEYEKSLESMNKALDIAVKIGNSHTAAKILTGIGATYDGLDMREKEIEFHEEAIALARKNGAVRVLGYALSNAGAAYIDIDELDKAMKYLGEAAEIFERLGEQHMFATATLNKAIIALFKEDKKKAIQLFNECEDISNAIENNVKLMDSYHKFGLAHKKMEYLDDAISYFNKALAISKKIGDKDASRQIKHEISQLS